MALPPGRTISGAYGYSGGTPAGLWTPNPYGMAAPAYAHDTALAPGYMTYPQALPIKTGVAFGTAKPAVFSAAAAPAGGVMRTPSEPLSDTTGPVHKAVPAIGRSDPRYSFFKSSEGGVRRKTRRTRRKTTRHRGGGTTPSEWIVELHRTPTRETLDRVVGEIRRSSGNRNLVGTVDGVVNMLRLPLGARETREQRLAEIIRRVIFHLREIGPVPPPNAENVKGVLGIKGASARGFAPGGVEFPKEVENRLVGFLAPSGRDDSVERAIGEVAALKGKRLPRTAPPPGGYGPSAAGGPGGPPAGGRRRSTRRRR